MVEIVEASSRVSRQEVHRVEKGNVVSAVNIDGLHETEGDPRPHHDHVVAHQQDPDEKTET